MLNDGTDQLIVGTFNASNTSSFLNINEFSATTKNNFLKVGIVLDGVVAAINSTAATYYNITNPTTEDTSAFYVTIFQSLFTVTTTILGVRSLSLCDPSLGCLLTIQGIQRSSSK